MKIRQVGVKLLMVLVVLVVMAGVNLKIDGDLAIRDEFDSKELQTAITSVWAATSRLGSKRAIDDYLAAEELRAEMRDETNHAKIKPQQRKKIVWNGELKTPFSIVYVHGFSAGPLEIQPTLDEIGRHLGANVFATRLTAHGLTTGRRAQEGESGGESDGEGFARVQPRDWVLDVEEALAIGQLIGDRVVVVAMSTGVPLVLESVDRRVRLSGGHAPPLKLASLVLLSPNYDLAAFGSSLLATRFGVFFAKHLVGDYYEFKTENEFHRERWTSRYRSEGLHAMMSVVRNSDRIDLHQITIPVMTIYTSKDDVVSVRRIEERSHEFGGAYQLIDWPLSTRHQLSSAAFVPERAPEFTFLILKGLEKFNIRARKLENELSKGL